MSKEWTVDHLLKAQPALERLVSANVSTFADDPHLAFDLARIYRQIEPEISVAHQQRVTLMRECGAEEEGQNLIFHDLEKRMSYQERYNDLIGSLKRPLNVEPLKWSRLQAANLPLRVADIAFLEGLVFETDDGKEGE